VKRRRGRGETREDKRGEEKEGVLTGKDRKR
jgi:hypothetical protein